MVMGGHGRGLDGGETDHDVHDDNDCFHGCHCCLSTCRIALSLAIERNCG